MQISGFSGRTPLPLPTPMASPPHFGYSRHTKKLFDQKLLVDGSLEDLQKIVDKGANVNAKRGWRSSGATSLILLLWGKINETTTQKAEILLKAGADTEATTERFKKDPFRAMEGLAPPILKALQQPYIDSKLVNLLLEYGADPRTEDYNGLPGSARLGERSSAQVTPPVIIDTSKPGAWESRETIDPNSAEQKELRKALKEKIEAYAEILSALEAGDAKRFSDVLRTNLKLSPTDDPELPLTERLLFNSDNLGRVERILGKKVKLAFLKEFLNNPLDANNFYKLDIGLPLSYRKIHDPESIKKLQKCLGKSDAEMMIFLNKAIQKEISSDLEKVDYTPYAESKKLDFYKKKLEKSSDFIKYQELENKEQLTEQERLDKEDLKHRLDSTLQKKMANHLSKKIHFKQFVSQLQNDFNVLLKNGKNILKKKEQPQPAAEATP